MEHSAALDQLAPALAAAQAQIRGAAKTVTNTYFKSTYADIAAVWESVRGPLTAHGFSVVQSPEVEGTRVTVTTLLLHASGQWLRGTASAEVKDLSSQSVGSAVTYLRRYALSAFASTYGDAVDDDGEAAQGRSKPSMVQPRGYDLWLGQMQELSAHGTDALKQAFTESPLEMRQWAREHDADRWNGLKEAAAQVDSAGVPDASIEPKKARGGTRAAV